MGRRVGRVDGVAQGELGCWVGWLLPRDLGGIPRFAQDDRPPAQRTEAGLFWVVTATRVLGAELAARLLLVELAAERAGVGGLVVGLGFGPAEFAGAVAARAGQERIRRNRARADRLRARRILRGRAGRGSLGWRRRSCGWIGASRRG